MSNILFSRIVIQLTSPLALHSGDRETGANDQIARDWNDLPYIPATSIAGVLKSAVEAQGKQTKLNWFGSSGSTDSQASSIIFTDGHVLDSRSVNTDKIITYSNISKDPLLNYYNQALKNSSKRRCHVNQRGCVAKDGGTFSVTYLPTGARFAFDIYTQIGYKEYSEDEIQEFKEIIAILNTNDANFGSNISNGFGQFKVVKSLFKTIDLSSPNAEKELQSIKKKDIPTGNEIVTKEFSNTINTIFQKLISLDVKAKGSWSMGTGLRRNNSDNNSNQKTSSFCYSEETLTWNGNDISSIDPNNNYIQPCTQLKVSGSSVKGIIAHRTDFHYRRINELFADNPMGYDTSESGDASIHEDIAILFGYSKDNQKKQAGCLIVKDADITIADTNIGTQTHNKIDYFSGGTITSALFTNEILYKPKFKLDILFNQKFFEAKLKEKYAQNEDEYKTVLENIKKALRCTFVDIEKGYISIASKTSRGGSLTEAQINQNEVNEFLGDLHNV